MLLSILSFLTVFSDAVLQQQPTIVMTMFCRDEEVNLRSNLKEWLNFIDYFVILIDSRNADDSKMFLNEALKGYKHVVQDFQFEGFGHARTLSLQVAWHHYKNASHVLIADPGYLFLFVNLQQMFKKIYLDWWPDPATINKNDLLQSADAYRFTLFDKNGAVKKRMDWLLKHRAGLAMKYSLHEVLVIGNYSAAYIDWVVHELAKNGTWHMTVGHGHAMSATRYLFDINLLIKDLAIYGHDPHVHYYLGITYHAYLISTHNFSRPNNTLIDQCLHYLHLRVSSVYEEEFYEERWAVMYTLGIIYASYRIDIEKAKLWFSLCRDYNPQQVECGTQLSRIYVQNGMIEQAYNEILSIIQQDLTERIGTSYVDLQQCTLPSVILEVFGLKASMGSLSTAEAKYFLLILSILRDCKTMEWTMSDSLVSYIRSILAQSKVSMQSPVNAVCADQELVDYLTLNQIKFHACPEIRFLQVSYQYCNVFAHPLPPASEDSQFKTYLKAFAGAALIYDIIHHVHFGDKERFLRRNPNFPLKLLFLEYFNPSIVYNLIGTMQQVQFKNYKVTVVTPHEDVITEMKETILFCKDFVRGDAPVTFIQSTADIFLEKNTNSIPENRFDYIEYNGGLSKSSQYFLQLKRMRGLLITGGVIGLTFFSKNRLVDDLVAAKKSMNRSALPPLSLDFTRYVRSYLDLHKLGFCKDDVELMSFLSGEVYRPGQYVMNRNDIPVLVNWKTFRPMEVKLILNDTGLVDKTWVPALYAQPYGKLNKFYIGL